MGIPSVLPTNPLVGWPLPLLRIHLLHHYLFRDKIRFCLFLLYTSTSRFKWIRIGLPYYLVLWHASDCSNHLLLLLGKIPSQQGIFPKEVTFCFCCEFICHSAFLRSTLESLKSHEEYLFFSVVLVGSHLHMFLSECL